MGPLELARARSRARQALARRAANAVGSAWRRVDRNNIAASWLALLQPVISVVEIAQAEAARTADIYLDGLAEAFNIDAPAAALVRPAGFVGVASDGRELATLMYRPAVSALGTIARGGSAVQAMTAGRFTADLITRTQVADAGRAADITALTTRHAMTGYIRVLSRPSCSRCAILAGRHYRWNAGFRRHPRCDCVHLPVPSASIADPLITRPRAYFDSLTEAEQNKAFTSAGAEAIRRGADPGQVVNARRGAAGLTPAGARITAAEATAIRDGRQIGRLTPRNVFGRDLFVTTEGTTTRGIAGVRLGAKQSGVKVGGQVRYRSAKAPRLMPESILQIASGDRAEAERLLRRFGYLL